MRYDVYTTQIYSLDVRPHFCREWDESGGCYGTNEEHGMSFEEAKEMVLSDLKNHIAFWENMTEDEYNKVDLDIYEP